MSAPTKESVQWLWLYLLTLVVVFLAMDALFSVGDPDEHDARMMNMEIQALREDVIRLQERVR